MTRDDVLRGRSGVLAGDVVTAADLVAAGWRVVTVTAPTKPAMLAQLAEDLDFPGHFGHNLDALLDSLRDLSEPVAVVWPNAARFQAAHPHDYAATVAVFRARAETPGFAAVLGGR